ncbi:2-oxoglutarate dehydrogenase complex dihydrolipoyllysine-residue succinyltransferase [Pelagicoccus sp. SDUM812003]|uniref:2-oxoglutarate dehydrogenase complex dihydrolipoyllysine-residue succinyltransferase n=1 Tax=Pelagicoccus sp. SDUM812003 TaxID=3041267 RepID=UPI00280D3AB0|nr:2-oxoglutarate dehydrogenase complex dihydrolipoyllysine-residue succinyltransferase [Pelagicoccus sp. SDUM812003]MDQ8202009.1 2-oxoglutarate dehydrogenase complex dihydrolipoyllysine-residue succinyltransferase [Pelagicoccus sp. SDUM812003]
MATEVIVPTLGESITSGIIAAWNVQDGDYVEKDQVIYELETDKITSEGIAEVSGVVSLSASEGDEVEIGQVIATIDESAEAPSDNSEKKESAEEPEVKSEESGESEEAKPSAESSDAVSPAVRRIAAEEDLDPASVEGSGKAGRVTKGDMLKALSDRPSVKESKPAKKTAAETPKPAAKSKPAGERTTRKRMTPLRKKIAERLVSAQQDAAMLTTFNEADMTAIKELRAKYQDSFVKKHGIKLGFMSFFVKAVVQALQEVPGINAQIDGDEIIQNHYFDIGVAVSTEKGLMVPVIRDCDQLNLAGIEKSIIEYAKKAREGKIQIDDLQGGVFTITNGGIFGSMLSTPILNAPQSGILGMHAIQERPVAVKGQVEIRPMMYLAVSYDHRIVDGKEAVTFLVKVKEALEDPTRLLLDV